MPNIPDDQKPAIGKVIAPAALFYFRWAAFATIVSGLILAWLNGYVHDALILGIGSRKEKNTAVKKFARVLTDYPKRFCIPKNQTTKN